MRGLIVAMKDEMGMVACYAVFRFSVVVSFLLLVISVNAETLHIISSIRSHFHPKCVYIVRSEKAISELEFQKSIATLAKGTQLTIMKSSDFDINKKLSCVRPLFVIFSDFRKELNEVSKQHMMSSAIWLLLSSSAESTESYLADVDIPFNCEFLVSHGGDELITISEVYRTQAKQPLQWFTFAVWSKADGFRSTKLALYERRNNLQGITLKATAFDEPPATVLTNTDGKTQITKALGDVYEILERELNFTTSISAFTGTDPYASLHDQFNASPTGMVDLLHRREVDISLNLFNFRPHRAEVCDYTFPLMRRRYKAYIAKPKGAPFKWLVYFDPFAAKLWLLIVVVILVSGILLTIFNSFAPGFRHRSPHFTTFNALFCVLGLFLHQGHDITPKSFSARILFLTAILTGTLLFAAYTAVFFSFLTVRHIELPFEDLIGVLQDKSYKMNSLHLRGAQIFEASRKDEAKAVDYLIDNNPVPSAEDGLTRVCKSKFVFVLPADYAVEEMAKIPCNVVALPKATLTLLNGWMLVKNSPYTGLFNHVLHKLRANGVLSKLNADVFEKPAPENDDEEHEKVGLKAVVPLLTLLALFFVLASLILVYERHA